MKESSADTFIVETAVAVAVNFFRTHVARGPHVSREAFDFFLRCRSFCLHTAGRPPENIQPLAGNRILKFTIFHFVAVVTFTSCACYDIFVFKAPGNTRHELYMNCTTHSRIAHITNPSRGGGLAAIGPVLRVRNHTVDQFWLRSGVKITRKRVETSETHNRL